MSIQTPATTQPPKEKAMEFVPFGAADKIKLTLEIVKNIVAKPTKSGKTCSDRDAMRFMMLCQVQRLNPFAGDAFLTGYDGRNGPEFSLITAHVAFMKRAEASQEYEGMESGIILQGADGAISEREGDFSTSDENVLGGWARIYRKGRKPTYKRLSIAQRKPNYETPFWDGVKAHEQIVKCAEADALRATFPTLLGGMHVQGETVEVESIVTDIPTRGMVAEAGALPEQQQPGNVKPTDPTPQQQLEAFILAEGYTFADLMKWGGGSGNIDGADSIPSFADIPTDVCNRLLRAKSGLVKGLEKNKATP